MSLRLTTKIKLVLILAALMITVHAAGSQGFEGRGFPGAGGPQPPHQLGFRFGYDFDYEMGSFGFQFHLPIDRRGLLTFVPSGDLYWDDTHNAWQFNLDAAMPLGRFPMLYGGGGLAVCRTLLEDETEEQIYLGGNVLLGLHPPFPSRAVRPFIEYRWTWIEDDEIDRLVIGLNILFGGMRR